MYNYFGTEGVLASEEECASRDSNKMIVLFLKLEDEKKLLGWFLGAQIRFYNFVSNFFFFKIYVVEFHLY